jgi:ornithine cyclodeaminase/alanine dehydrogenase-like protein (mu-crystallin family)
METVFSARAAQAVVAPPRWTLDAGKSALVFTTGAINTIGVTGFRVYSTPAGRSTEPTQLTVVFDTATGAVRGVVLGSRLGQLRTGAIGGVAAKCLSNKDAAIIGVIGSGPQARAQVRAIATVRRLRAMRVFSPTQAHRNQFAVEMGRTLNIPAAPVASAEAAVRDAHIVILATNSATPVLDGQYLAPGAHVHSLGAKRKDRREVDDTTLSRAALIATDAPEQLAADGDKALLYGTRYASHVVDLAQVVIGSVRRPDRDAITLFLSAGLAGTEVALAARLLTRHGDEGRRTKEEGKR